MTTRSLGEIVTEYVAEIPGMQEYLDKVQPGNGIAKKAKGGAITRFSK